MSTIKELKQPIQPVVPAADNLKAGGFGVIGAGPVALAMKYFFEIQALYLKLMQMYKDLGMTELTVSGTTAKSTADAVESAAHHQAASTFMQAGGMMAQGVAGGAATLATPRTAAYKTADKKLTDAAAEQKTVQDLNKAMVETKPAQLRMGPNAQHNLSDEAVARRDKILAGDYKMTEETPEDQKVVDEEVLAHSPEVVQELKKTLPPKLQEAASDVNTAESELKRASDRTQGWGQTAGNALNALGQTGAGIFQYFKGTKDAIAEISKATQGLASQATSQANKAQNDDASKSADEIRQLQAMRDGSKTN